MRRRVIIDSGRQAFTIPVQIDPSPITEEIEIDCIHCRALRARDAATPATPASNRGEERR